MRTQEYRPPTWAKQGDEWIVSQWESMSSDFGITPSELTRWHECMAGQGRPWEICRLLYGIRAVLDLSADAADFLRTWKIDTIAKRFELTPLMIADQHRAAITYWKQWNASAKIQTHAPPHKIVTAPVKQDDNDDDILFRPRNTAISEPAKEAPITTAPAHQEPMRMELPKFAIPALPKDDVETILSSLRLSKKVTDPDARAHIANRALALQQYLVNPLLKENARQIIIHEITLMNMEDQMTTLSDKINRLVNSDKLDDYTREYREMQDSYSKLTVTYQKQLEKLGVEEIEKDNIKAHAIDTLGWVTQAIRAYRANGDNSLIDGVFRADEIVWQLEPVKLRPSQYRPDIVVAIKEAFTPANLFDPAYKPKGVTKKACDKMRRMLKLFDEEFGIKDNSIPEIEAPPSEADPESNSESEATAETIATTSTPQPTPSTTSTPPNIDATAYAPSTGIPHFSPMSHNRDDDAMAIAQ